MSYLYVTELGSHIGIRGNRIEIKYKDDMLRSLPIETVDVIKVFGNMQFTTQCYPGMFEKRHQCILQFFQRCLFRKTDINKSCQRGKAKNAGENH